MKNRGYTKNGVLKPYFDFSTEFGKRQAKHEKTFLIVYPEFVRFFTNVKYLVSINVVYKGNVSAFCRAINVATGSKLSGSTLDGYIKGYFLTAQYNWLVMIADFCGQNVHEMLTLDFRERDERIKEG